MCIKWTILNQYRSIGEWLSLTTAYWNQHNLSQTHSIHKISSQHILSKGQHTESYTADTYGHDSQRRLSIYIWMQTCDILKFTNALTNEEAMSRHNACNKAWDLVVWWHSLSIQCQSRHFMMPPPTVKAKAREDWQAGSFRTTQSEATPMTVSHTKAAMSWQSLIPTQSILTIDAITIY